jgi:hypothetical protein
MQPLDLLIITLATFYAAYAISWSHGPWEVFQWLRRRLPLGGLTACLVCLAPWLAALFYVLMFTPLYIAVNVLAIAGASVLLWRYTGGSHVD